VAGQKIGNDKSQEQAGKGRHQPKRRGKKRKSRKDDEAGGFITQLAGRGVRGQPAFWKGLRGNGGISRQKPIK